LSNEEKTNDYENFEKKGGGSREKGGEETKYMPHASVIKSYVVYPQLRNEPEF
jgi:hypothetical protein